MIFLAMLGLVFACSPARPKVTRPIPAAASGQIPNFDHIVIITFENKEFDKVIGNLFMPAYNGYARKHTLLTQYYAVTHPSLPNYLAMVGGSTFGIEENCEDCYVEAPSLPDLIEASGRTWKAYQEDMQTPCALGSQDEDEYVQKHNPFVYFNSIRLDEARCQSKVVPLEQLWKDAEAGMLPSYSFVTPNMCNNGHDCRLYKTDFWLRNFLNRLLPALEKDGPDYLVVLNWDEGEQDGSCCGLPPKAGGRIPVVLISPLVKEHFQDSTPYTHYSLLKTISKAWDLPYLGHAADESQPLIEAPWK